MTLKLAIWDMDGTIVDSRQTISESMDRAFVACGLEAPGYAQTRQMVGLGLFEGIAEIAPAGTDERVIHDLCSAYKQAFVAHRSEPGFIEQLYEGAAETLERLANENWLQAIATGKSHRGLDAIFGMHDLKQYFDTIWCADDGRGKPHPFMCLEAMGALGAEAHQSVMIGDAVHDMRMARAADVRALGVSWGFGEASELTDAGAHIVHHSFSELNTTLETLTLIKPGV